MPRGTRSDIRFKILGKLGCLPEFIRIIENLHSDIYARVIIGGELFDPTAYKSGVKQGCKLAPTLFGIYAAVLLSHASSTHHTALKFALDMIATYLTSVV